MDGGGLLNWGYTGDDRRHGCGITILLLSHCVSLERRTYRASGDDWGDWAAVQDPNIGMKDYPREVAIRRERNTSNSHERFASASTNSSALCALPSKWR